MPGASRETVRRAFMRPITVRREKTKDNLNTTRTPRIRVSIKGIFNLIVTCAECKMETAYSLDSRFEPSVHCSHCKTSWAVNINELTEAQIINVIEPANRVRDRDQCELNSRCVEINHIVKLESLPKIICVGSFNYMVRLIPALTRPDLSDGHLPIKKYTDIQAGFKIPCIKTIST